MEEEEDATMENKKPEEADPAPTSFDMTNALFKFRGGPGGGGDKVAGHP